MHWGLFVWVTLGAWKKKRVIPVLFLTVWLFIIGQDTYFLYLIALEFAIFIPTSPSRLPQSCFFPRLFLWKMSVFVQLEHPSSSFSRCWNEFVGFSCHLTDFHQMIVDWAKDIYDYIGDWEKHFVLTWQLSPIPSPLWTSASPPHGLCRRRFEETPSSRWSLQDLFSGMKRCATD